MVTEVAGIFKKGFEDTKAHKFTDMSIDCDDNGILTKTLHHSKRHCNGSKFKKRDPNGAMTTQNDEGQ
ncbi:hypothetical protein RhiirC2_769850 [Rhizophagus irregularis]|uniref:Uncharacterized protein n=1 Tax=Rhizophagus irregularis TaxID=588596 RepID=A0A2N1NY37_9GLOM|nr:hypothetical protein RhiirC2_769850 [Rhizophagus irregularis]